MAKANAQSAEYIVDSWQYRSNLIEAFSDGTSMWDSAALLSWGSSLCTDAAWRLGQCDEKSTSTILYWNRVAECQLDAMYLLSQLSVDQSLALLRVAAELARECAILNETDAPAADNLLRFASEFMRPYPLHEGKNEEMMISYFDPTRRVIDQYTLTVFEVMRAALSAWYPVQECCFSNLPEHVLEPISQWLELFCKASDQVQKMIAEEMTEQIDHYREVARN